MRNLVDCIKESLDDNAVWKIEMFFRRKPNELKQFNNILKKCREDLTVDEDKLKEYLDKTSIKITKLIDFIDDDVSFDLNKDYMYAFKKLIERLLDDKTVETI